MGNQLDEVKKEVKEVKQGIIDVRREVKEEFDGFRKETESKFEGINADMKRQREEWRKPKHAELSWRNETETTEHVELWSTVAAATVAFGGKNK